MADLEHVVRTVNVRFPSMRRDVMFALAALADRDYQSDVWVGRMPRPGYSDNLDVVVSCLYDDCQVLPDPTSRIGSVLVEGPEIARLRHLGEVLDVLLDELQGQDDAAFLDDIRWRDITETAGLALSAMVIAGAYADQR
jgi:hypothetical protein